MDQPGAADPRPARPDPLAPVPVNVRRIVLAATAAWALALVVSLALWVPLGRHHAHVVVWTCVAGTVLGGLGYAQVLRHRGMGRTV